jgi:hypothetical protein
MSVFAALASPIQTPSRFALTLQERNTAIGRFQ